MSARHRRTWLAIAAIALGGLTVRGAMASGRSHASLPSQQAAIVKSLVSAVNKHRLAAVDAVFTRSSVLAIGKKQYRGRKALNGWWKGQFSHDVKLTLNGAVDSSGAVAHFVVLRQTQGGDCPKGCWDGSQARFSGGHISALMLTKLNTPTSSAAGGPTLPTPGPPPGAQVTPTIPS